MLLYMQVAVFLPVKKIYDFIYASGSISASEKGTCFYMQAAVFLPVKKIYAFIYTSGSISASEKDL